MAPDHFPQLPESPEKGLHFWGRILGPIPPHPAHFGSTWSPEEQGVRGILSTAMDAPAGRLAQRPSAAPEKPTSAAPRRGALHSDSVDPRLNGFLKPGFFDTSPVDVDSPN